MNAVQAQDINVDVDGQRVAGYLVKPAVPGPGVMVMHAWWGLNEFFKGLCDRLADEGFIAFAPDLNAGVVARTVAEAEQTMQGLDEQQTWDTAKAATNWFREQVAAQRPAQTGLGLVGFSAGVWWSLQIASQMPDAVGAVVVYYDLPEMDYSSVRAAVQCHFAGLDDYTPAEGVEAMEKAMRDAGTNAEVYKYPQAGHWFIESNQAGAYREEDARLAWERTVAFLKKNLMAGS